MTIKQVVYRGVRSIAIAVIKWLNEIQHIIWPRPNACVRIIVNQYNYECI